MKNKTKGAIIDLCALVLWAALFVVLVFYAQNELGEKLINAILFSVIGLALNYTLCVAFHETGHLIFAKANKMRAVKINFGFLSIDYTEKSRLKLFTFFGENAGESNFLPTERVTEKVVKCVALGGILFNAIYFIAVVVVILVVKNPVLFCLFGAGGVPAGYLLTVNAIPLDKTADGAVLISKKGYARACANISEMQRQIQAGKAPIFEEYIKKSSQPLDVYCDFLRLSTTDAKKALSRLNGLKNGFDFTAQEYELIFPEMLFNACIGGFLNEELINRAENFFSQETKALSQIRAHYAYRKARGEAEWANAIFGEYQNGLKTATEFEREVEINLINLLD